MNILEYLQGLDKQMNSHEVDFRWIYKNKCPDCGKEYYVEDDEYTCLGITVGDYKKEDEDKDKEELCYVHHLHYPDIYKTDLSDFRIALTENKIIIEHIKDGNKNYVCNDCGGV